MSQPGAPAAYRGYRLQALYILKRILTPETDECVFQPEGKEDLDIRNAGCKLIESVQVKSYPNLAFSDLWGREKADEGQGQASNAVAPFFRRAVDLLAHHPSSAVRVVNFGKIGPELMAAWSPETAIDGDGRAASSRRKVTAKLSKKGVSPDGIDVLFSRVQMVDLDEDEVTSEVFGLLSEIVTGIDPENAFDLLNFWIYRISEKQQSATRAEVIQAIQGVGKFLAECRAHHAEWFTVIRPIEGKAISETEMERLREEFYQGVSARFEHIAAGLDFIRPDKLYAIARAFDSHSIVILHAASGQGKTALAYRYLHDNFPESWRFSIELIEGRQHALRIATALNGHASALKVPAIVYIDVRPNDTAWPELAAQLSRNPYLKLLVTIREEDLKRADLAIYELDYGDVDLAFNETEARWIYNRAVEKKASQRFLDFDAAWAEFGGKGPLMEFVFLLTQTTRLETRLRGQVQRIRREAREKHLSNELKLFRLVAVATAFEARVQTRRLIASLDLSDPGLTLDFLEDEYLIRRSSDKQTIEALHPIRSRMLTVMLTSRDAAPWIDAAGEVLPMIVEEDLEPFLFRAFLDRSGDCQDLLTILSDFHPKTWIGVGGVLRSLLWAGIRDYVEANEPVIQRAMEETGLAWWLVFDFDLMDLMDGSLVKVLWDHITPDNKAKINDIRSRQLPKSDAFGLAKQWLSRESIHPASPASQMDWRNFGETIFWASFINAGRLLATSISEAELRRAAAELPLSTLADVSFGLYTCDREVHGRWMDGERESIEKRVAEQYDIVVFENDAANGRLMTHFIFRDDAAANDGESGSEGLNNAVMEQIYVINRLFPEFETYASRGYGWKAGGFELSFDPTHKEIPRKNLMSDWAVRVNRIAFGLAEYERRPETWEHYVQALFGTRKEVVYRLRELHRGIDAHFRGKKPAVLFRNHIDTKLWDGCTSSLSNLPKFPKVAVDPWGFVSEGTRNVTDTLYMKLSPIGILLQRYKAYLSHSSSFLGSLGNLFSNSIHVITTNSIAGKLELNKEKSMQLLDRIQKAGCKTDMDHLTTRNIWEAVKAVEAYQRGFRDLFGQYIDADELTQLEDKEREAISQTWKMWFFYAKKPHIKMTKSSKNAPIRIEAAKRELDGKIDRAIEASSFDDMTASRLRTDLHWNGESTVWIELDLKNLVQLREVFEKLVDNLKDVFSEPDVQSLEYYLIEAHYENVVVIPLFRGKLFSPKAWPLKATITLCNTSSREEKPCLYVMKPISPDHQKRLGYDVWSVADVDWANRLIESFSKVWLLCSQIHELSEIKITESTTVFQDIADDYGREMSSRFSDYLLEFAEAVNKLVDRVNQIPEEERPGREELMGAISLLQEVHQHIQPSGDEGKVLTLDEIGQYAASLEKDLGKVEIARLLWISDVINF